MSRGLNIAAAVALVVVILFFGATKDSWAGYDCPTPTPVVTPEPTPTPTATPVPTPEPTATPVPTATPCVDCVPSTFSPPQPTPTATDKVPNNPERTPRATLPAELPPTDMKGNRHHCK